MKTDEPRPVQLKDYVASAYAVREVVLDVSLDPASTEVQATLTIERNHGVPGEPLRLDGEHLTLKSVRLNGEILSANQYQVDETHLSVPDVPQDGPFTLKITSTCSPKDNTALSGLYQSNGIFCTQCEAEGFRRIAYHLDRPDVMAVYRTRIEADKACVPVLLSNGNLVDSGELEGGRHFAEWHDPFPKPSYLFALVAGDLVSVDDHFTTRSGRVVQLRIFVEPGNEDRCAYAMDALKRSMRWDEEAFGREYDLDIFMIVAVSAFNMGAMENKGLNVFNDKYILASPETATDNDFAAIEAIIAHEYFHNWTGNRITCRDWFQLCLKEGLTVFRDQEFTSDMRSRAVKRISDVRLLRSHQFPEDDGPLAHPVRPDSYIEINNFYTATVYEKGAELVRMIHTLLGPEGFRKGMDLYFERHDGEAATVEDFLQAMEDGGQTDLTQFRRWYSQAGTPEVLASGQWDAATKRYRLKLSQVCAPTPGQPQKDPLHIPIRLGLVGPGGQDMAVALEGEADAPKTSHVLNLTKREQSFQFAGVDKQPVPSLLRGFSAPVKLTANLSERDRTFLMTHDSDPFNRWEAGQRYATGLLTEMTKALGNGGKVRKGAALAGVLENVLADTRLEPDFLVQMLVLPAETTVAQSIGSQVDVDNIHNAREKLRRSLASQLEAVFRRRYEQHRVTGSYSPDAESAGHRALRNVCLGFLAVANKDGPALAFDHFTKANNMTDAVASLAILADLDCKERTQALEAFYDRWKDDHLVMDKWFAIQAMSSLPDTLDHVRKLKQHPAFSIHNPNKVRALVSSFASANQVRFHGADGAGYAFVADTVLELDGLNPQVAARLMGAFKTWSMFDTARQKAMTGALERVLGHEGLSRDTYEIASKIAQTS